MCGRGAQQGVRCVPVHHLRSELGLNFWMNSDLKHSQRRTGLFCCAFCGRPGDVWTTSIESRSHSPFHVNWMRGNSFDWIRWWLCLQPSSATTDQVSGEVSIGHLGKRNQYSYSWRYVSSGGLSGCFPCLLCRPKHAHWDDPTMLVYLWKKNKVNESDKLDRACMFLWMSVAAWDIT